MKKKDYGKNSVTLVVGKHMSLSLFIGMKRCVFLLTRRDGYEEDFVLAATKNAIWSSSSS